MLCHPLFHNFDQDQSIVSLLGTCLQRTQSWRHGDEKEQLLLSFIKSHKEVVENNISCWVKQFFKNPAVDIDQFKAHSTISAVSSNAGLLGLSVLYTKKIRFARLGKMNRKRKNQYRSKKDKMICGGMML